MDDRTGQANDSRQLISLAAERTLMAWVRTALAMMALGFVIDRFSLLLRRFLPEMAARAFPEVIPLWAGTAIVGFGALFALIATARYVQFYRRFQRGQFAEGIVGILLGTIIAGIVGLGGVVLALFMAGAFG